MTVQSVIEGRLQEALVPSFMQVENESHMHAGGKKFRETHFKVTLVSAAFAGKRLVQRHQQVYALLQEQLQAGVHALALHLYTPDEWQARGGEAPLSPECLGGSKHDHGHGHGDH